MAYGSKNGTEAMRRGIQATMHERSVIPYFNTYLHGPSQILLERLSHRLSCCVVKYKDVALGVEIEGSEIKIRGTDY
jgi:hypothetical protein